MIRHLGLLLLLCTCAFCTEERDLGKGLLYVRITNADTELPEAAKVLSRGATVLDLRNARGGEPATAELARLLSENPAKSLRLVLINGATAPAIAKASAIPGPSKLTLGPALPGIDADIPVAVRAEDDQRAYEALAAGVPLDRLISSNAQKRRFDESSLTQTRPEPAQADEDNAPPPEGKDASGQNGNGPPHDVLLGRAVHIHRAMTAWGRG